MLPHPGPRASCCRSFGYALTGNRPVQHLGFDTRTERVSALCAFSVKGFEDWRFVSGTYNGERFLEAAEDMVVPLVVRHPIVVLDNASIHKSAKFFQSYVRSIAPKMTF